MSIHDETIAKGRKKRKLVALISVITLFSVISIYFGWLFLTKGYSFEVLPNEITTSAKLAVSEGNGFFIENKLYIIGGAAKVIASAPKYRTADIDISAASPTIIQIELKPLPATINITTSPSLDAVSWSINGESYAQSSNLSTELLPGQYQIGITHQFYESTTVEIDAQVAQDIEQNVELIAINGTLKFESSPSNAKIFIDGNDVGTTPLTINQPGGKYAVKVQKAGYEPVNDNVSITRNNSFPTRKYTLIPEQATISVSANPVGGALFINGRAASSQSSVDANTTHTLRYEKKGFISQSKTVKLTPGENKNIQFSLDKELASVTFLSNVDASVEVDGKPLGNTPLTAQLQTIPHEVTFSSPTFRSVQKRFTPKIDGSTEVAAQLLTEFEARRQEGKPLFVKTLGIEMSSVKPRAFTMGSAPNEKNRQRNEHNVKVDFEREIWISRHEITEKQFSAFKQESVSSDLPIVNVTWNDAALFTNWLSRNEALEPFYTESNGQVVGVNKNANGYRLPTEAEWEFIAKINRRSKPTTFVWGTHTRLRDKQGNFADQSRKGQQTFLLKDFNDGFAGRAPIGSFKPERSGFFDLDGNVREWVHDFYSVRPPKTNITHINYLGISSGTKHVVKGASFKTGRMKNLRASLREGVLDKADDIGFRIARYANRRG